MICSAIFCLNAWSIEYDLDSVKDISTDYSEEIKNPNPIAYLKGKYLFTNGFKLHVKID